METFYIAWFLRKINRTLLPPLPIISWCPQSSINNMIIFGKGCYWQFCYEPKLISYKNNTSTASKKKKIKKKLLLLNGGPIFVVFLGSPFEYLHPR